jgi:hypothetical protein
MDKGTDYYLSFQEHLKKILVPQKQLSPPYFFNAFNLGEKWKIYCMGTHFIIYYLLLAEINMYQGYFNSSCH